MTQPSSKVLSWHQLAYTLSLIGLILSGMMHLGTYVGLNASSDKPTWLYISLLTLLAGAALYNPAYWAYMKTIYAFNGEEWKYPAAMSSWEKRRFRRTAREVWKSNPTYTQIGMPYTPKWMRAAAFPFFLLSELYLGTVLMFGVIINTIHGVFNWYVLHSMTLFSTAMFFAALSLYHSKLRNKHSDQLS